MPHNLNIYYFTKDNFLVLTPFPFLANYLYKLSRDYNFRARYTLSIFGNILLKTAFLLSVDELISSQLRRSVPNFGRLLFLTAFVLT